MKEAVIFDMDGVLVDSQPFHYDADIAALSEWGINAGYEVVVKYTGMALAERLKAFKDMYGLKQDLGYMISRHVEIIKELVSKDEGLRSIDGITELLNMLKGKQIKLAVASSSSYDFVYMMLEKINIKGYFDNVTSGEDMKRSKPEPDIFLKTAEKLSCPPDKCVVIEDSTNGIKAANAAFMKCVGYINKSSGDQDLSQADFIVASFRDLINKTDWLL